MKPSYHAIPGDRSWSVRRRGSARAAKSGLTKEEAWGDARRLAKSDLAVAYLYGEDGRIRKAARYT